MKQDRGGTSGPRGSAAPRAEAGRPHHPALLATLSATLAGPLPEKPLGEHCYEPRDCAFQPRCWPDDPAHIRHLYRVGLGKTALS